MAIQIVGGAIPSIAYTYTAVQTANTATFTFAGAAIGTAKSTRRVVVGLRGNGAPIGVTINGITATELTSFGPNVFIAAVPLLTTATIVVSMFSSTTQTISISVAAVYDIRSTTPFSSSTSVASPAVLDLNTASRGVIFAMSASGITGGTGCTWTGATENLDVVAAGDIARSIATVALLASETPRTVRCAYNLISSPRAVAFSWR